MKCQSEEWAKLVKNFADNHNVGYGEYLGFPALKAGDFYASVIATDVEIEQYKLGIDHLAECRCKNALRTALNNQ